jgi:hypothetical protein
MPKPSRRTVHSVLDESPPLFCAKGKYVLSANGKRHLLFPSKYPGQPLIDRMPFLKRAMYYYFKKGERGREVYERLPDIKCETFDWAYQTKLSALDGATPPAIRRQIHSSIYFVGCDSGPVKIGLSINVKNRLATLQSACPFKLKILAIVSGGRSGEADYHRKFSSARLHGEWFERSPEILAELDRLNSATNTNEVTL